MTDSIEKDDPNKEVEGTEEEGFLDEKDLESGPDGEPGKPVLVLGTDSYFEVRWAEADGGSASTRHGSKFLEARQVVINRRNQGNSAVLVFVSAIEIPV